MDRSMLKRLVEYRVNWILTQDHKVATAQPGERLRTAAMSDHVRRVLRNHPDERVRSALSFENAGYKGFALLLDQEPVCVVHFTDSAHYEHAETWPLADHEVALVNIITLPQYRSRGYASQLIKEATAELVPDPFVRAIAFIWWNHTASLRAFRKAGWKRIGFSLELVRRKGRTFTMRIPLLP